MKRPLRPLFAWLFSPYPDERQPGKNAALSFSWRKFRRHFLQAAPWIVILMVPVYFMEASGALKGFESAGLDTFLRFHSRKMSDRVVIVEITDQDYESQDLFQGKSPLKRELLTDLISNIQRYDPTGFDPGHCLFAMLALITATGDVFNPSLSLMSLPRRIASPIVLKYPGETSSISDWTVVDGDAASLEALTFMSSVTSA